MNRIGTAQLNSLQSDSIARTQGRLAQAQQRLASGLKSETHAGLGQDAITSLSSRSMMAAQEGYATVSSRLQSRLGIVDSNLSATDSAVDSLRTSILAAIGTGESPGLQEGIDIAFQQLRATLNASSEGSYLFAGGVDGAPFQPATAADLVGKTVEEQFTNGSARATARVAAGVDMTHGILATDVGTKLVQAFRTLAEAGSIGDQPTDAQMAALTTAAGELQQGLSDLRTAISANGRRQAQLETFETQATERTQMLEAVAGTAEDADMAQVAVDITQQKTILEASYGVLAKLSALTLLDWLR